MGGVSLLPMSRWNNNEHYTNRVRVLVDLGIQHAMRMRHIVVCDLPRSTKFFHIISQTARFSKKSHENKMCVLLFCTTFVWNISHSKKKWAGYEYDKKYIYWFLVKYTLFSSEFHETWIFAWNVLNIFKYEGWNFNSGNYLFTTDTK